MGKKNSRLNAMPNADCARRMILIVQRAGAKTQYYLALTARIEDWRWRVKREELWGLMGERSARDGSVVGDVGGEGERDEVGVGCCVLYLVLEGGAYRHRKGKESVQKSKKGGWYPFYRERCIPCCSERYCDLYHFSAFFTNSFSLNDGPPS